jgi:hypothetical protein
VSCQFLGDEVLSQVHHALSLESSSAVAYLKFVECLPMINLLFQSEALSNNTLRINFHRPLRTFEQYMQQT